MLGLGGYGSSSEDEVEVSKVRASSVLSQNKSTIARDDAVLEDEATVKLRDEPKIESGPINGPILGPSQPSETATPSAAQLEQGQSSPYSASRALIQDLTLPPVPNLEIPPSPPGSPNPVASGKTTQFLSLKKQGVHFNDKLSASSSLKNPSLFVKLREHTGIYSESQYSTTLPHEIWDHTALPAWAYKEELYKTQQSIRAKIDEAKQSNKDRRTVEFVPSSGLHD